MYTFPKNFIWGAATSGPQSEGNFKKRHQNVFDYWYTKDPSAFYAGVGPDTTSNFYNDYENDLKVDASSRDQSFKNFDPVESLDR